MHFINLRLILLIFLVFSPNLFAKHLDNDKCLDCHGVKGFSTPDSFHGEGRIKTLDLNVKAFTDSVHGKVNCVECHDKITKLPHKKGWIGSVDCVSCHLKIEHKLANQQRQSRNNSAVRQNLNIANISEFYKDSIHANKKKKNNASCESCHTAHYVYRSTNPKSTTFKENSPFMCGECHKKALKEYKSSIHGAHILRPWKGKSATCSDCHSAHQIKGLKKLASHRVVTKQCGDCHKKETDSYMMTTHGQLAWLGNKDVPKCETCHQAHDTREIKDSASLVSKKNILKTCKECHKEANDNLIEYRSHGNTKDFDKYPIMYVVAKGMIGLVIVVLIFFYSHSMLWLYREFKSRPINWQKHGFTSLKTREKKITEKSEIHFRRFDWYWRINHWALALSVMTLVLTGMAVMYPDTSWAMTIVAMLGGPDTFNQIHRVAGVIFLAAINLHVIVVLIKLIRDKKFEWFGPDSLLPRWKDWEDMKGQFRWFFNKGPQPKFDRWVYWEKFDYWAVYWGSFVIGSSGLILWFSDEVMPYLPGWAFNIAALAHGLEAFLAVMTLFVVHFFNNHFRPYKFPLDTVMFTGSWDLEEFKEERPLHYQRLVESGELEKRLVKAPGKKLNILVHILGFSLLAFGLFLLILVSTGFSERGLF